MVFLFYRELRDGDRGQVSKLTLFVKNLLPELACFTWQNMAPFFDSPHKASSYWIVWGNRSLSWIFLSPYGLIKISLARPPLGRSDCVRLRAPSVRFPHRSELQKNPCVHTSLLYFMCGMGESNSH